MKFYSDTEAMNMTFGLAYYKGKFIGVPYLEPEPPTIEPPPSWKGDNPGMSGRPISEMGIIKILDPFSIPLEELKAICEENNLPIYWVIGAKAYGELYEDLSNIAVADAIEKYLKTQRNSRTIKSYRNAFQILIKWGLIDPKLLVKDFIDKPISLGRLRSRLRKNEETCHFYYRIYRSFYKFLEGCKEPENDKEVHSWASQRETEPLSSKEWKQILPHIKKINKKVYLIALVLKFFGKKFKKGFSQGSYIYVSLTELLRLKPGDLRENRRGIEFRKYKGKTVKVIAWYDLPKYLFEPLKKLAMSARLFVFDNKKGGPLHHDEIARVFRQAGKKAGISRPVSPILLRPIY